VSGAGAASIACVDLLVSMGLNKNNVRMLDRTGVIYAGRTEGMNKYKQAYAVETNDRTIDDAITDADLFMGLSGPGVLNGELVKKMARDPLILAMSNPTPEIMPEEAIAARPDAILATGRSDYPNQVNNVLCFPFIFRGALDCGATTINEAMKKAAVTAIADLVHREITEAVVEAYAGEELKFGRNYLIPKPFDARLIEDVPLAVVKAAMESGVATRPIHDLDAYRNRLQSYVSGSRLFMQPTIDLARANPAKIAYAEGENDDVLLAMQAIIDEGIAKPVLLGRPSVIEAKIADLGLRIKIGSDVQVMNIDASDLEAKYWQHYHQKVGRSGVSVEAAKTTVHTNATVMAGLLVDMGEVDGMICGKVGRFDRHLKHLSGFIQPSRPSGVLSSICALLLEDGPLIIADPFVNVDPTEDEIVTIAQDAIEYAKRFDIVPRVALLSHSNFGTYEDASALKMKQAAAQLRNLRPDVQIDGEMHSLSALNPQLRDTIFEHNQIDGRANVLIMPNMDTASIALGLIRSLTEARLVGPFLYGLEKPVHILIPSVSGRGILNMTALAVADIHLRKVSAN